MLKLNDQGMLYTDMVVGPAVRSLGGRVAYSGAAELTVLTSGRNIESDWLEIVRYFLRRLQRNVVVNP